MIGSYIEYFIQISGSKNPGYSGPYIGKNQSAIIIFHIIIQQGKRCQRRWAYLLHTAEIHYQRALIHAAFFPSGKMRELFKLFRMSDFRLREMGGMHTASRLGNLGNSIFRGHIFLSIYL